jgi:ABC transporter substrate binding protein
MQRRAFLGTLAGGLFVAPLYVGAQPAARIARLGYLWRNLAQPHLHEAFLQGLRALGYVEGRNVAIEFRDAEGNERLPAVAAELVALKVDVIVATATPQALAAKQAPRRAHRQVHQRDPVGLLDSMRGRASGVGGARSA